MCDVFIVVVDEDGCDEDDGGGGGNINELTGDFNVVDSDDVDEHVDDDDSNDGDVDGVGVNGD